MTETNPNPSQDRVEELRVSEIRLAHDALRDPIFKTEDKHGRAIESAIYRMANSEIARCYLRLVAAQSESEPATVMREALDELQTGIANIKETLLDTPVEDTFWHRYWAGYLKAYESLLAKLSHGSVGHD